MSVNAAKILSNPVHCLAFGFGSGLSPIAPGTAGTVVAVPLYLLLAHFSLWIYVAVLVFAFLLGIYLCGKTADDLGVHDHPGIVWDEFVGYWITMLAAPIGWGWMLLGFVLFRVFDIWKPWPISWLDRRVTGGLGIMVDDVLAGFYALIIVQLVAYVI
ncbi:MAG: phosphatidylglycerophosphatase A [Spongiibacteraceae bacterium]|nr:phosphatidylglycerophosphatase A [Spongiibacteraceae bacterium]